MIARDGFHEACQVTEFEQAAGFAVWHLWMAGRLGDTCLSDHESSHIGCERDNRNGFSTCQISVHAATAPVTFDLIRPSPATQGGLPAGRHLRRDYTYIATMCQASKVMPVG